MFASSPPGPGGAAPGGVSAWRFSSALLGSGLVRLRDLETLEFPRVLDAIAALARSAAGRQAVLALRPTSDTAEAERRLDLLAELVALGLPQRT